MIDMGLLMWLVPTIGALILLYVLSSSNGLWRHRRIIGEAATALLVAALPFLFVASVTVVLQIMLVTTQLWLLILGVRLFFGRLDEKFLQTSTKLNTSLALVIFLLVLLYQVVLSSLSMATILTATLIVSLAIALVFLWQTLWTLKHYRLRNVDKKLTLKDLPTVTLAIPARNETHVLTECLSAAVASDYPKLEIIVLDDCSQDATSELIRSFAHSGVRFIQGDQPASGWLGKNQAEQTLTEHASGEYIIFADVDTRLSPQSITKLVTYALSSNAHMVSVLPQRREGLKLATLFWQLRYYWQVVLPITKRRVPVASQAWLIRADALQHLGGFNAVKQKIVPEGSFARRLFGVDLYRFIISNPELGITTAKRWSSQAESAIRLLYPTFKRQPLYVLIGFKLLAVIILAPFITMATLPFVSGLTWVWLVAASASLLFVCGYALVVARTNPRSWLLTTLFFPLSLVQELVLLVVSLLLYEFGDVTWKGRNVCYPVIGLPALPSSRQSAKSN